MLHQNLIDSNKFTLRRNCDTLDSVTLFGQLFCLSKSCENGSVSGQRHDVVRTEGKAGAAGAAGPGLMAPIWAGSWVRLRLRLRLRVPVHPGSSHGIRSTLT